MRKITFTISAFVGVLALTLILSSAQAQPGGGKKDKGGKGGGSSESVDDFVKRMMEFNKAKDGKLTKEELTDKRLHALFDRADANKDGVVTREELEALYAKESAGGGGPGGDKGGGKGGKGGDKGGPGGDGKGPKGKGGPQPGIVLPPFVQDALNLTDAQRAQIAELQKDVDARLSKILTDEQRTQLREMKGPGMKKGPPPGDK
jgi:hypothetical protein